VTTKAEKIALNEAWHIRSCIVENCMNYKEQFIAYIEKGKLPVDDLMGMFHSTAMYSTVGIGQYIREHMATSLEK
jgi:hypothetical protein